MIDPVRFISNVSTGLMGFELAKESCRRGYSTTLISGPTVLKASPRIQCVPVVSSLELEKALRKHFRRCDILFMPSAVCDFRPAQVSRRKIKRHSSFTLKLVSTPDLLKKLTREKGGRTVVGFCLETENLLENARRKLSEKKLDFIVANQLGKGNMPFGSLPATVFVLGKNGSFLKLVRASKRKVARKLLDLVINKEK